MYRIPRADLPRSHTQMTGQANAFKIDFSKLRSIAVDRQAQRAKVRSFCVDCDLHTIVNHFDTWIVLTPRCTTGTRSLICWQTNKK